LDVILEKVFKQENIMVICMKKTLHVAFAASASYFIIYILIKFFLENAVIDWKSALTGALAFWFFIFLVHYFLNRAKEVPS
jgi:hypothetical protein